MIGRLVFAASVIASLLIEPAMATPGSATNVTWNHKGVLTWQVLEHHTVPPKTVHRLTVTLRPGRSQVLSAGRAGLVERQVQYRQRDGGPVSRAVLWSQVVRTSRPRIVAIGIGATPLASFAARGIAQMAFMARSAIEMIATGYTADSAGGSGTTAIGRRAGLGIVAVDPRIIPLGTRLYIPGYGLAVAGDTGGAIVGNRIDLGFNSLRDAMLFGRRSVEVYQLK